MSLVTFLQLRNSLPTSPMSSSAIQTVSCYVPQPAVVGQSWSTLDNLMAVQILRWRLETGLFKRFGRVIVSLNTT